MVSMLGELNTYQESVCVCICVIFKCVTVLVCQRELASIFLCCVFPCLTCQPQQHTGLGLDAQNERKKRRGRRRRVRKEVKICLITKFGLTGLEADKKKKKKVRQGITTNFPN